MKQTPGINTVITDINATNSEETLVNGQGTMSKWRCSGSEDMTMRVFGLGDYQK